jgi:hypothetical protein
MTSAPVIVRVKNGLLVLSPQDTTLSINSNNYSADPLLMTYTWPDNKPANAILMKFDLSPLPAGAVVQDAQLFLALLQSDTVLTDAYNVSAHKVVGHNPAIAQANGYFADNATPWSPSACCHDAVPLAQSDISPAYATTAVDARRPVSRRGRSPRWCRNGSPIRPPTSACCSTRTCRRPTTTIGTSRAWTMPIRACGRCCG